MKTVSKSLRRGGVNWESSFPEGEDERSMQSHKAAIKDELKKKSPDKEKVKARMMLTFADRRRLINNKTPLLGIMNEYPALFCYDEVQYFFLLCEYCTCIILLPHQSPTVSIDICSLNHAADTLTTSLQILLVCWE